MRDGVLFWSVFGLVAVFVVMSWVWVPTLEWALSPFHTQAATSSSVTVSASVAAAISCATDQTDTAFGTLVSASVSSSTPNASTTMACANAGIGCTLYINDTGTSSLGGGLWSNDASDFIESPNAAFAATSTLAGGTEGYGIRATTTSAGGGALLSIAGRYNILLELSGSPEDVGGLTTSTLTLASTTASSSAREIVVTHKATIAGATPGGSYGDTITYSCTAN